MNGGSSAYSFLHVAAEQALREGRQSVAGQPQRRLLGDITNRVQANGKVHNCVGLSHAATQPAYRTVPMQMQAPQEAPLSARGTLPRLSPVAREQLFSVVFEGDAQDPQRASEYAADIFSGVLETETLFLPKADFMTAQTDINGKMRAILIDWLVEVHMKYRLRSETLFLAVSIIDRYLSVRPVMRNKLQLLGVVAMFIAAKYEEIDPPKVREFSYITEHAFSKKELLSMECRVLTALEFQIAVPTIAHVFDRLQRASGGDAVQRSHALYALELSLLDIRYLWYPPSSLVSAALLMINDFEGRRPVWPPAMVHHTHRCEASLAPCAAELKATLEAATSAPLQAVRRKYQLDINYAVANLRAHNQP